MASSELQSEDLDNAYQTHPSLVTASLLLRRFFLLSQRPDMVSGAVLTTEGICLDTFGDFL